MSKSYSFRIPASTSNLGAGFDALSLALEMYLNVSIELRERPQDVTVEVRGVDSAKIPVTRENLILRVAQSVAAQRRHALPPFHLIIENQIPLARGLGSSAAAIIAGITCYELLAQDPLPMPHIFQYCHEFESHPDNLAAALTGGLVAAAVSPEGEVALAKLSVNEGVRPVLVVPDFELPTEKARGVLPQSYSRPDVVFNIQRSALTIAALTSGNWKILREAMRDRVHQPFRASLIPGFEEILSLDLACLLGVALSGAGPTVLAFAAPEEADTVGRAIAAVFDQHGVRATPLVLNIDNVGRLIV